MGRDVTISEIKEIMSKHDKSNDGIISFDEFKLMLLEGEDAYESKSKTPKNNNPDKFVLSKSKSMRKKAAQRI